MGILGLWDVLGEGQVTSITELAAAHYQTHKRPFRIAIDEAGWRYHNLNDQQVAVIRAKEPAANPIEKAILHRLVVLLRQNIQPIFVFDGPGRPWKRGKKGGGRVDYEKTKLLKELLKHLQIPHHRAPAEAEAECAAMQKEGVVDAVWSDDGDTLMFGATMLVKEYRDAGGKSSPKSKTHVRVYTADRMREEQGLDWRGLVAFAVLAGGDYNVAGLKGCGPQTALDVVKHDGGKLGQVLCSLRENFLYLWNPMLVSCLKDLRKSIGVPLDFPSPLVVNNYRSPKVSSPVQLHNLNGLRRGWDVPIDETGLRDFLRSRFNFWAKGYLNHITPLLLVKKLRLTVPGTEKSNLRMGIELVAAKRNAVVDDSGSASLYERKITYLPLHVTTTDMCAPPPNEDWRALATKTSGLFQPSARIEVEVLNCLLEQGLGCQLVEKMAAAAEEKPPVRVKRKSQNQTPISDDSHGPDVDQATDDVAVTAGKTDMNGQPSAVRPRKKRKLQQVADGLSEISSSAAQSGAKSAMQPSPDKSFRQPRTDVQKMLADFKDVDDEFACNPIDLSEGSIDNHHDVQVVTPVSTSPTPVERRRAIAEARWHHFGSSKPDNRSAQATANCDQTGHIRNLTHNDCSRIDVIDLTLD